MITEFLLARIAEDEDEARGDDGSPAPVGMWDPDRVLAECEAKRRILEEHPIAFDQDHATAGYCELCQTYDGSVSRSDVEAPCPTLVALASVYAGHLDFDEAWRV